MKTVLLLCVALTATCVCGGAPSKEPKSLLTEIIIRLIDGNRDKLANLHVDTISLYERGELTNLTFTNGETFVLEELSAPGPLSMMISNATITLEQLGLVGDYFFNDVPVPDLGLVLNGLGAASAGISGARAELTNAQFHLIGLSGIQLDDFDTLTLTVQGTQLSLEGVDQITCDAIAQFLPKFLARDLPGIIQDNKGIIIYAVNDILSGIL